MGEQLFFIQFERDYARKRAVKRNTSKFKTGFKMSLGTFGPTGWV